FFFSSRRRHTRFSRDWSSDVCSSDLPRSEIHGLFATVRDVIEALGQRWNHHVVGYDLKQQLGIVRSVHSKYRTLFPEGSTVGKKIGRASCREGGERAWVADCCA